MPELARLIAQQEERGLGVKIHCAGDAAVRATLDAIEVVRSFKGVTGLTHHIAHAGFIDPADIQRFKELNVVADLSPILWYPNQIIVLDRNLFAIDLSAIAATKVLNTFFEGRLVYESA